MQSGIDSSRLRIGAVTAMNADGGTAAAAQAEVTASQQTASADQGPGFFGPDGPKFRDVLDAINPLNHIPIVSDIFASATGHQPSTASKLVGGALLGGPIGFVTSLASVIYTQEKGASPVASAYAALTGDDSLKVADASTTGKPTAQLAEAEDQSGANEEQLADASPVLPVSAETLAAAMPAAGDTDPSANAITPAKPARTAGHTLRPLPATLTAAGMASATANLSDAGKSKAVLDLYGTSPASANNAYRQAQFRPYLQAVSQDKVL